MKLSLIILIISEKEKKWNSPVRNVTDSFHKNYGFFYQSKIHSLKKNLYRQISKS